MSADAIFRDEKPWFYVQEIRNPRRIMCECKHRAGNPPVLRIELVKPQNPLMIFPPVFLLFEKNAEKKSGHVIIYAENKKGCFCLHPEKKWSV